MSHQKLRESASARQCYDVAVRWSDSNRESIAPYAVELAAIQAEAEVVLGLRPPAMPADKDKEPASGKK